MSEKKGTHFRTLTDRQWLGACDFANGPRECTIVKVSNAAPPSSNKLKLTITLKEFPNMPWLASMGSQVRIALLYGKAIERWPGNKITLYRATGVRNPHTGKEDAEGIRVK